MRHGEILIRHYAFEQSRVILSTTFEQSRVILSTTYDATWRDTDPTLCLDLARGQGPFRIAWLPSRAHLFYPAGSIPILWNIAVEILRSQRPSAITIQTKRRRRRRRRRIYSYSMILYNYYTSLFLSSMELVLEFYGTLLPLQQVSFASIVGLFCLYSSSMELLRSQRRPSAVSIQMQERGSYF